MQQQISHRQIRHLNARPSARRQHRIYSRVSAAATDSVIAGTRTKLLYDGVSVDKPLVFSLILIFLSTPGS
jgi:hypothetical protein